VTRVHAQAHAWVARYGTTGPVKVLDIGGRNINGTVRGLFPAADYTSLDIIAGDGVDIVADASTWTPTREYDLVVCCEVFEHTDVWPQIIDTAYAALRPGGLFVATMAGPGRAPHSAIDGSHQLYPGEWYANVEPDELRAVLDKAGFVDVTVDQLLQAGDVRCVATRPGESL
jgi:SAM-dependent methyltransferase